MVSYRFNLLSLGISDYRALANRALRIARRATAVDTGRMRRGWRVRLVGDFLFVENSVPYAAPVELGSIVHKRHKHRVRDALSSIGLTNATLTTASGNQSLASSEKSQPKKSKVVPLSLREIRSPGLISQRFKSRSIKLSDLFKPAVLASLIAERSKNKGVADNELSQ